MSDSTGQQPTLKWDGSFNLGTILGLVGVIVTVAVTGNMALGRIDTIQVKMIEQANDFKELRSDVGAIKLQLAAQDGLRTHVDDLEGRVRQLEGRR